MRSSLVRLSVVMGLTVWLCGWSVRAAAPAGRYTASGGVVHDNKTGLDWQQAVDATIYHYADALTYCSGNTPGLPGVAWRLPEIKELQTLVDVTAAQAPAIDATYFPSTQYGYWSSTITASDASVVWIVLFNRGETSVANKFSNTYYVRCVR